MQAKDQVMKTYGALNHWHSFRLKLFWEGILIGICSGLVISLFRWALHVVETNREHIYTYLKSTDWYWTAGWFALLILVAFVLDRLTKYEPLAAGSGIPQVKGAILGFIKMRWLQILWVKLVAGVIGIGAGLSLGREGPSIQLGAVTAQGISRLFKRTRMEERYLLTSGASAGLAAAFNAPLAGVIFALEELHRNFSVVVLLPAMAAAMTATVISRLLFGGDTIFDFFGLPVLPLEYYGYVVLISLIVGLGGVVFNAGLLNIPRFYKLPIFPNSLSKIVFALFTAGVLGFVLPQVLGGGNTLINEISKTSYPLQALLLLLVGKFIFTMLSYGSGVPGGFFLPMLVIGALTGSVLSNIMISLDILNPLFNSNIIVIAMAAFFAASVRAPITGTILIMEMTGSFQHMLVLSIASMVAFIAAELCHSKPIYEELLARSLQNTARSDRNHCEKQRNIIELSVCSGSPIDGRLIKEIDWPEHTLLVDVKRGESDLIPIGDTRLRAGDFLYVLTDDTLAAKLRKMAEGE